MVIFKQCQNNGADLTATNFLSIFRNRKFKAWTLLTTQQNITKNFPPFLMKSSTDWSTEWTSVQFEVRSHVTPNMRQLNIFTGENARWFWQVESCEKNWAGNSCKQKTKLRKLVNSYSKISFTINKRVSKDFKEKSSKIL